MSTQTPYFETDLCTLYLTDCLPAMREMPDKAFDLAIVDPPYGIGNFIPQNMSKTGKTINPPVTWNNATPSNEYFIQVLRISASQIIWGANYYNCFSGNGGSIVWDKGPANPIFSRCEIASISSQKRVDYVLINWQSGFHRAAIENIIHPCQKPVALYRWLLTNYAKPGDTILDTHLGSGSIAIACHDMGFHLTAFEIDEEYLSGAAERIKRYLQQPKLFTPKSEPMKQECLL